MNVKSHAWQLSNLELSKKLKELGVKQESLFYWVTPRQRGKIRDSIKLLYMAQIEDWNEKFKDAPAFQIQIDYSAFTVAELGEMLPNGIIKGWKYEEPTLHIKHWYKYPEMGNVWEVYYEGENGHCGSCAETETLCSVEADTIANTMAKMLVYLIENDLMGKE